MTGKIIVIEGIDGAGKATQSNLLKEWLEKKGKKVSLYSYPDYNSVYGERIKSFLYKKINLNVDELFLLYLIDMVKDKKKMLKEFEEGNYIIIDRFFFSTVAYQSAGGFSYDNAKEIVALLGMPAPDKVFYINVPVEVSMYRKEQQKGKMDVDKFESNKVFLSKVSEFYNKLAEERFYSVNWSILDGKQSVEDIAESISKEAEIL